MSKETIILALAALLIAGPAMAQQPRPRPLTGDLVRDIGNAARQNPSNSVAPLQLMTPQQIAEKIAALSLKDFVYADALAKATGNKVTEPCWSSWVRLLTSQQQPLIGPSLSETVSWNGSGPVFNTVSPHNLMVGQEVTLQNPPAGFTAGTNYYVIQEGDTAVTFELAASPSGAAIVPTGPSAAGTVLNSVGQVLQPPDPGLVTAVEYVSEAVQLLQSNSPIAVACAPMAQALQQDFITLASKILSGGALGLFKLPIAVP